MRYSSGVRFSRAKPTGSFRVLQAGTRRVASHDETLQDARKSATYWTSAVSSPMEIQERFPSGAWITVETMQPKSSVQNAPKRAHAATKREIDEALSDTEIKPVSKGRGTYLVFSFPFRRNKEPLAEFPTLTAAKSFAEQQSSHRLRWKKEEARYEGNDHFKTTYYSDDYYIELR